MSTDTEGYSCRLLSHDPDVVRVWVIIDRFGNEVDGPVFNNHTAAQAWADGMNAAVFERRFA